MMLVGIPRQVEFERLVRTHGVEHRGVPGVSGVVTAVGGPKGWSKALKTRLNA